MKKIAISLGLVVSFALLAYGSAYLYFHAGSPDETCRLISRWGGTEDAGARLERPMGLMAAGGLLYVADTEDGSVEQYRPDGSLVARWSGFRRPVAVAPSDGGALVADFLADEIVRVGPDGQVRARWGDHGTGPGAFDGLGGIATDNQGNVFVSDFYNHRIQRFDRNGTFLGQWGGKGRTSGRFRFPAGIAVSPSGEVFVADAFNNRIQVFTTEGKYLRQWGGIGFGIGGGWPGWFRLAKELALDPEGNVYVADAFNGRIQKFTPEGDLLAIWDPEDQDLRYPSGIAVDAQGTVYASEFYADRVSQLRCQARSASGGSG